MTCTRVEVAVSIPGGPIFLSPLGLAVTLLTLWYANGLFAFPWPFAPQGGEHNVDNGYGQFQEYGADLYFHDAVDIEKHEGVPMYAVFDGVVTAIANGDPAGQNRDQYWYLEIRSTDGTFRTTYGHIDRNTIPLHAGDDVSGPRDGSPGTYLGDVVDWFGFEPFDFDHCHFAVERNGAQTNPLMHLAPRADQTFPVIATDLHPWNPFANYPFAFRENGTTNYLSSNSLSGQVDVIAKVYDTFHSNNAINPIRISYSIQGRRSQDWSTTIDFSGALPRNNLVTALYSNDWTYNSGNRDFYVVVTNLNCDETQAWNTEEFPNGRYTVSVRATDVGGNSTIVSMLVRLNNPDQRVDVVQIIDRSGSMRSSGKIAAAKEAAGLFVDMMEQGDKIGVVSFASSASVNFPLTEIMNGTRSSAKAAIDTIWASGATSIGAGLQAAWGQLQPHSSDPMRAMVLMSDGWHNRAPHPSTVLPSIDPGVLIYTIGFGSGADGTLLSNIAHARNGEYYHAPSADQIREIYFAISGRIRGEQLALTESGTATSGQTGHSLLIDGSATGARVGIDWSGSDLDLSLVDPHGTQINHQNVDQFPNVTLDIGDTYEIYTLDSPLAGQWEMLVDAVSVPPGGEEYRVYALLQTPITIELQTDNVTYVQGDPIGMTVTLSDGLAITGANVVVEVTAPGEPQPFSVTVHDDGAHNDGAADDGVYGGTFTVTRYQGSYRLQAEAEGTSNQGYDFQRVVWQSVVVNYASDPDGDGMPTDWEIAHGLDPIVNDAAEDPDGDNLPNIAEYQNGTDPQNWDTDGDGYSDSQELIAGSDPLDPNSVPMDDVTSEVGVVCRLLGYSRATLHSICQATITNTSGRELGPELWLVIGNIDPANVTLVDPDGTTSLGLPYIDVGAIVGGLLAPGANVVVPMEFHNADRARFMFGYALWATGGSGGGQGGALAAAAAQAEGDDELGLPSDFAAQKQARLEDVVEGTAKKQDDPSQSCGQSGAPPLMGLMLVLTAVRLRRRKRR